MNIQPLCHKRQRNAARADREFQCPATCRNLRDQGNGFIRRTRIMQQIVIFGVQLAKGVRLEFHCTQAPGALVR